MTKFYLKKVLSEFFDCGIGKDGSLYILESRENTFGGYCVDISSNNHQNAFSSVVMDLILSVAREYHLAVRAQIVNGRLRMSLV